MRRAKKSKGLGFGMVFRIILGVILAVITYRGVMLCEMEGKLHIPLYPVVVVAVCAVGTGCALLAYIMLCHNDYTDSHAGYGCLQVFLAALALVYVLGSAVPVFYATIDTKLMGVFPEKETYDGEITAVSEPEDYPQVIPFSPKVTRYDCDYKYYDGPIGRETTKTYTGSFNTTVKYSAGDEIFVLLLPENPVMDKYVPELSREFTKAEVNEIAALIAIYLISLIVFVPFSRARSGDDDSPIPDNDPD